MESVPLDRPLAASSVESLPVEFLVVQLVFLLRFQMMIRLVGASPFSSHYVEAILVNAVGAGLKNGEHQRCQLQMSVSPIICILKNGEHQLCILKNQI